MGVSGRHPGLGLSNSLRGHRPARGVHPEVGPKGPGRFPASQGGRWQGLERSSEPPPLHPKPRLSLPCRLASAPSASVVPGQLRPLPARWLRLLPRAQQPRQPPAGLSHLAAPGQLARAAGAHVRGRRPAAAPRRRRVQRGRPLPPAHRRRGHRAPGPRPAAAALRPLRCRVLNPETRRARDLTMRACLGWDHPVTTHSPIHLRGPVCDPLRWVSES